MVEVIPDVNLSFKEYQASLQQLPSNIFYQRVQSRNVSNQQCSFTVSSPNKRSYLLSNSAIEWVFTLNRTDTTDATFIPNLAAPLDYGATGDSGGDLDLVTLKPVLPVANCISSITTSINGSTNTIAQPRRFMECVSMMHVTRDEATKHYEAGYPESMGGQMNQDFAPVLRSYNQQDHTMQNQYYEFANRQLRGANQSGVHFGFFDDDGAVAASIANNTVIKVTEPLISPPFDCYSKVSKHDMPDWSPWKWMSPVVPNIDRLEIDIQFTKLDASLMYYFYGRGSANDRPPALNILSGGVQANLLLYWAEVPVSTTIPRSLDLQSWNVREFQDSTNGGAVVTNLTAREDRSSLIQLNSVPSLILTHLERDKDSNQYLNVACASQNNVIADAAANVRQGGAIHNWDNYGEINTITYLLGDRPNVISATFSQREIFDLLQKNCKEYPYSYDDWRGRKRPVLNGGAFASGTETKQSEEINTAAFNDYPCKGMVAVTGQDIANKTSTGVFSSNSLQVVVNWRPHSGYAGSTPGNNTYQFYNHLLFGAEFLRIEPDKSQFQSQSLDESTARRLTDPPLGSMTIPSAATGGSLRVGGSIGVGGSLAPLRNRGVTGISSRLS